MQMKICRTTFFPKCVFQNLSSYENTARFYARYFPYVIKKYIKIT